MSANANKNVAAVTHAVGVVTLSLWVHRCAASTSTKQLRHKSPDTLTRSLNLMLNAVSMLISVFLSLQSYDIIRYCEQSSLGLMVRATD